MTSTTRKPVRKKATPTKVKVAVKNHNMAKSARPAGVKRSKTAANNPKGEAKPSTKPGTKTHKLITLLSCPKGATAEELMTAVGWQKHSVHGFLAGTVKKKLGLTLSSETPDDGPRRYRIVKDGE